MTTFDAVDLFAGPGGWDEGAKRLGLKTVGLEWDHAACQTAVAAGHPRIRCDVAQYPTAPFKGIPGLILSPPCPDFSNAGKRAGLNGTSGPLVWQAIRWADDMRPEWIAAEQVPAVLPIWRKIAHELRAWGYSTWTGILNAADYGVPQKRKRAILMASRATRVAPPEPTHSQYGDEGSLFGSSREPWVSMESAIGWGFDEPAATISGGGVETGGAEPFANAAYRRRLAAFVSAGVTGEGRPKLLSQPADTLTSKGTAYWLTEDGGSARLSVVESAVLQSFPPDYPWCGNDGKQRQQVGNAVPPLLAAHVLAAVTGQSQAVAA